MSEVTIYWHAYVPRYLPQRGNLDFGINSTSFGYDMVTTGIVSKLLITA